MQSEQIGGENLTAEFTQLIKDKSQHKRIVTPVHLKYNYKRERGENRERGFEMRGQPVSESIDSFFEMQVSRNAKERLIHFTPSHQQTGDQTFLTENAFELPDGERLVFDQPFNYERVFFEKKEQNPASVDLSGMVWRSLQSCDVDIRKNVISGVVLAGGNTLIPRFKESFEESLTALAIGSSRPKLVSGAKANERKFSSWVGASILSSTGAFQNMWISLSEYKESGESVLHRKCLN